MTVMHAGSLPEQPNLRVMKKSINPLPVILFAALFTLQACSEGGGENSRMENGQWVFRLHLDPNDPQAVLPFNVEATG